MTIRSNKHVSCHVESSEAGAMLGRASSEAQMGQEQGQAGRQVSTGSRVGGIGIGIGGRGRIQSYPRTMPISKRRECAAYLRPVGSSGCDTLGMGWGRVREARGRGGGKGRHSDSM